MNIVYMGTPDFAVPALTMLYESGHKITLVVTKPDRPQKRGNKVHFSPVKAKALEFALPISQPEKIKENDVFFNQITDAAPDLIVVAAYGKILPAEILDIPRFGAINIHASLLPKYRGAAPIHRAVQNGETETGVTLMYMAEGLDEGDIIAVSKTKIKGKDTGHLHDELAEIGAKLLKDKLNDIEKQNISRTPQNHKDAIYASMIEKQEGEIDFSKNGEVIERHIRAMTPFPGAYTTFEGKKLKIIKAKNILCHREGIPGVVIDSSDDGIEVKTGNENSLLIEKLQMQGKKPMDVADFLRGNKIPKGQVLG